MSRLRTAPASSVNAVARPKRLRGGHLDNASGVSCDLTFSARTAPIQEARQTLWAGARRAMDATRFDQFGRWTGTVKHPDGEFIVDEENVTVPVG